MVTEAKAEREIEIEEPEASLEAEPEVEAEPEAETEQPISFKTQAELDEYVTKGADSLANTIASKSLVTYQQKIGELQKELRQAKDVREDNTFSRLMSSFKEQGEDDQQVINFEDAAKDLIKRERAFREQEAEWNEKHEKATQNAREVNAFTEALGILLPEDDSGFVSSLTELTRKIAGAESDREKALIIELEKGKLQAPVVAKPKRTKPDSNLPSSQGETGSSKEPEDVITRALAQERKKLKI